MKCPFKIGDKVILKDMRDVDYDDIPRGSNTHKDSFMDGKIIHTVKQINQNYENRYNCDWLILLDEAYEYSSYCNQRTYWTYSEGIMESAIVDVTNKVHNILRGCNV